MLEPKSLRKALIPPSLLLNPSPGSLQSTRLAVHVNDDDSRCSVFIASGCRVYKIELSPDESMVSKGKESLLIPIHAQVLNSSMVNRCPHRSEIQSIVLVEGDGEDSLVMGTVDSYGHLIVSRLDKNVADVHKVSYSVLPQDSGVGEGSWAGTCFSPVDRSMVAVARSFCKSVDVYDQDIHIRSLHTLWYPASLCFVLQSSAVVDNSVLAVAEGSQVVAARVRDEAPQKKEKERVKAIALQVEESESTSSSNCEERVGAEGLSMLSRQFGKFLKNQAFRYGKSKQHKPRFNKKNSDFRKDAIQCYGCKKFGHMRVDCPDFAKEKNHERSR